MLYHFCQYKENKQSSNKQLYLAYPKLSHLNTKIRNIFDKLKDTCDITVVTGHPQRAEPPNPIIKCANCNRKPIQNCALVYQRRLCIFSSGLIISRRPFAFIKVSRYTDPIEYLLCNQYELYLSDKDSDKSNGPKFIWPYFYWSILRCKDIHNHYSSGFIWKLFL